MASYFLFTDWGKIEAQRSRPLHSNCFIRAMVTIYWAIFQRQTGRGDLEWSNKVYMLNTQ